MIADNNLNVSFSCEYDALYMKSSSTEIAGITPKSEDIIRCGNWTSKLKLLRYISEGNILQMKFITDHSKESIGYHAKLAMKKGIFEFLLLLSVDTEGY